MKSILSAIVEWVILAAVCYILVQLDIFKYIAFAFSIIAYLGIGCIISAFAGDEPKPWLEKHPVILTIVHIVIAVLWLPLAILLAVYSGIIFVLELFGIKIEKE